MKMTCSNADTYDAGADMFVRKIKSATKHEDGRTVKESMGQLWLGPEWTFWVFHLWSMALVLATEREAIALTASASSESPRLASSRDRPRCRE